MTVHWPAATFMSPILESGSPRSEYGMVRFVVKATFLVYRWPSSHCALTWWRAEGEARSPMSLIIRTLIPFMRPPPSRSNHLPKAPLPNIITLGISISPYKLLRNTSIQSITEGKEDWIYEKHKRWDPLDSGMD